jgi:predicted O-linked N-acetylglucosamine transferase (SPINDLY family)
VSRFFQPQHSTALYYAGLIRELARTDLRVIVVGFAGSDDDLTYAMQPDKSAVVRLPLSRVPHTLFPALAEQEFDVLVYPDVGMDPWTYILASARLAPVQCALAGHPVTTGLPTIDYFLSSFDLEPTDAESHYSEQLVRFKQVLNYFERPKLSTPLRHRSDFGLPEDAHLFLCPQSLFKIHPAFDSLVGALLQADPQALVVLFGSPSTHWNELVAERLARSLPDVVERVRFLPWQPYEDYLHLLRLADAVLDPPHFGGGVTTFQALGVGAPVVTLPGAFSRSRMAYACYRRMDLSECIAADEDEYVRIAVRLASDQTWREAVQFKIQAAGPKIFENLEAVEEVGQFFRRVVAQALETQESA